MPKEMILEYLAVNKEEDKLMLRLVMQIAPLLKGMKRSCILVVDANNYPIIKKELQHTNIECRKLHNSGSKIVIFLFRRAELENYLGQEAVIDFLHAYGYHYGRNIKSSEDFSVLDTYLPLLSCRVGSFYEKNGTFPHEIGAFLGYPIQDVEGFIENAGKNFLYSGYWKVYANMQKAKELFRQFDEAKDRATRELLAGKRLCEIAG
ncbi:MAG: DUF3793 family protein [Lachnospiraceae bacterium]|nr:DUF3793 family protein [Lachnospiraceae bacterium]MDD3615824.1 DUF3793 family protein [Lachnospiraceae bacterium]